MRADVSPASPMKGREWGMLLALAVLWGGSFLFNAVALRDLPPFTVVWLRAEIAAATLLVVLGLLEDRKTAATALKEVHQARTPMQAKTRSSAFEEGPSGRKYPVIGQSWRRHWPEVVPFYAFRCPPHHLHDG